MTPSTCAFCEYFDGGGMRRVQCARQPGAEILHGDCLNRHSPRFETTSDKTCDFFFADTWPSDDPQLTTGSGSEAAA